MVNIVPVLAFWSVMVAAAVVAGVRARYPMHSAVAAAVAALSIGVVLGWPAFLLVGAVPLLWLAWRRGALAATGVAASLGAAVGLVAWVVLVARTSWPEWVVLSVSVAAGVGVVSAWMVADQVRRDAARLRPIGPGLLLAGRYRVRRVIGEGSSGPVYLASDRRHRVPVAVKTLAPGSVHEASAASLDSERVVQVLDVVHAGAPALVMEFMPGGQVGPEDDVRQVLQDVLHGLAAIHAAGLVHRDIKPANLLKDAVGRVKIADLGLAAMDAEDVTRVTGGAIGTVAYMSPEQARGQSVGRAGDLYSVAAVAYELVCGRRPFPLAPGESVVELQLRIAAGTGVDLAGIPDAWRPFFKRGLAMRATDRFASAEEMLAAIPDL